jgi:hypothetical protein
MSCWASDCFPSGPTTRYRGPGRRAGKGLCAQGCAGSTVHPEPGDLLGTDGLVNQRRRSECGDAGHAGTEPVQGREWERAPLLPESCRQSTCWTGNSASTHQLHDEDDDQDQDDRSSSDYMVDSLPPGGAVPQATSAALGQAERSWSANAARPGLPVSRAWRRARTRTR